MAKIKKIIAREILDSRANPTIETIVALEDGAVGVFSVPSGSSVGKNEAMELRDKDPQRYGGLGVLTCLEKIAKDLSPKLIGQDATNQEALDAVMISADGSSDKKNLGANTILSLSAAITKAQAASQKLPLYQYISQLAGQSTNQFTIPTPMFNILNGGKHGNMNLDFQEFMIVAPKSSSYSKSLKIGVESYHALKETLKTHNASILIGDEGGFAPSLYSNSDALKMMEEAVTSANYKLGIDLFFSIDAAASNFHQGNGYRLKDRPTPLSSGDLVEFYIALNEQYHFLSIEDPFSEEDWDNWQDITKKLGTDTLIAGDDLTTTNLERMQKAVSQKSCNAVVIKPNQIGTISETIKAANFAKESALKIIVSHRSGETNDEFIADFAVGIGADYAKFGAPARGERVAKYNRLLEIEHELS